MKFKLLEPLIIFVFRTTFVVQMLKGKRQAEKKNRTPQLRKCSAELRKRLEPCRMIVSRLKFWFGWHLAVLIYLLNYWSDSTVSISITWQSHNQHRRVAINSCEREGGPRGDTRDGNGKLVCSSQAVWAHREHSGTQVTRKTEKET